MMQGVTGKIEREESATRSIKRYINRSYVYQPGQESRKDLNTVTPMSFEYYNGRGLAYIYFSFSLMAPFIVAISHICFVLVIIVMES